MAGSDPTRSLGTIAVFAFLVGFSSATQDIAIDAWRIEAAEVSKQGAMAAAYQWGYRVAIIVAGAVPLLLAAVLRLELLLRGDGGADGGRRRRRARGAARGSVTRSGRFRPTASQPAPVREAVEWVARLALLGAGALVLGSGLAANAGVLAAVLGALGAAGARDAVLAAWASGARVWVHLAAILVGARRDRGCGACRFPASRTRPGVYLSSALADPLRDFFSRYRSSGGLILALICLYRVPDFVLNIMNPFYLDLGYTLVEIAEVRKIFGVAHDDVRRVRRRGRGGALRPDARHGHRRVRRAVEQSPVHLARPAGATISSRCSPRSASTTSPAASRARA